MTNKSKVVKLKKRYRKLRILHKISVVISNIFGERMLREKMQNLDQDILQLVKTDSDEMRILIEHDKIDTLKKKANADKEDIKKQTALVKSLIDEKNRKNQANKKLIKELTKRNIKQAKEMAEKEVEELLSVEDSLNEINLD